MLGQDITGRQTHQVVQNGISLVPEGRQILQDMSVYEKRPIDGSSNNNNFGRAISARPIASICC